MAVEIYDPCPPSSICRKCFEFVTLDDILPISTVTSHNFNIIANFTGELLMIFTYHLSTFFPMIYKKQPGAILYCTVLYSNTLGTRKTHTSHEEKKCIRVCFGLKFSVYFSVCVWLCVRCCSLFLRISSLGRVLVLCSVL